MSYEDISFSKIIGIYPFRSKTKIGLCTSREGRETIFGWVKCILCFSFVLAVAVSIVNAGVDAPVDVQVARHQTSVLDIEVESIRNGGKLVSVIMDGRTYYRLDKTDLPDKLIVELIDASLSGDLRGGNATLQIDGGPISSIDAIDDQNMQRVYVYIELNGEIEYTERSTSFTDEVRIEITPSSAVTHRYSKENRLPARTREPVSRFGRRNTYKREAETPPPRLSTRRRGSGTSLPDYRSRNTIASIEDVYVEDVGGGKIDLVIEADAPIYPRISEERSGLLIKISDAIIAWAEAGRRSGITGRIERRGEPRYADRRQSMRSTSSGKVSMRDRLSGRKFMGQAPFASRILPVNRGAVRQITVSQKSSNPALVEIVVDEEYLTEYQNIPQEDPNVAVYEIDTGRRKPIGGSLYRRKTNRRIISSATQRYSPNSEALTGRIEEDTIMLRVGHSITLETGGLEYDDTISLGNPKIAGVLANASGDLVINGMSRGVTNLEIWSRRYGEIANYQIYVYDDKEWLEREIKNEIGGQVRVRALNGTIFLEGTVETKGDSDRAQAIAQALSIDGGRVINNLKVRNPFNDDASREIELMLDENNLNDVQVIASGNKIILTGTVPSEDDLRFAENIAAAYADSVVNNLKVALPSELASIIESNIGMPKVRVRVANGSTAILRGVVASKEDKHSAEEIAKVYVPKVINSLEVKGTRPSAEDIASLIALPNITARWSESGDTLYLNGKVDSQIDADYAKRIAKRVPGVSNVISNIEVISRDQVNIKVKVVEINKTAMLSIGIDWPRVVSVAESFVPTRLDRMGRPIRLTALNASINALSQDGKARVLLDNNLTVISGKTANLLAGGQIPLFGEFINQQGVSRAVFGQEMREYGAKLNITPTVDSNGIINVELSSEVSGINSATVPTPSGPVFTLSANKIDTTLRMRSGDTIVMGGLIQQRESEHKTRVPLLGHIPLLGRLFTTTRKEKSETELVFILTTTIVTDMGMNGHLNPLDQNEQKSKSQFDRRIEEYLRMQREQTTGDRRPFKW